MLRKWLLVLFSGTVLTVLCILYVDRPLATFAAGLGLFERYQDSLPLKMPVLVAAAVVAVLLGGLTAVSKVSLSSQTKHLLRAATLAGLSMVWALCLNEIILKPIFGRTPPDDYIWRGVYAFHWFQQGDEYRSFPSGHMVQFTSVVSVFWILYPRWRPIYGLSVVAVAVALIIGEWHFLSDIVAGGMLGANAGVLMKRLWDARR